MYLMFRPLDLLRTPTQKQPAFVEGLLDRHSGLPQSPLLSTWFSCYSSAPGTFAKAIGPTAICNHSAHQENFDREPGAGTPDICFTLASRRFPIPRAVACRTSDRQ